MHTPQLTWIETILLMDQKIDILKDLERVLPTPDCNPVSVNLPYDVDSTELFTHIKHLPWAVLLDSCFNHSSTVTNNTRQHYDILAWNPFITLSCSGNTSTLLSSSGDLLYKSSLASVFEILQGINSYYSPITKDFKDIDELPFDGGAIGHFNYELIADRSVDSLPYQGNEDCIDCALGFYSTFIVVDHKEKKTTLVSLGLGEAFNDDKAQNFVEQLQTIFKSSFESSLERHHDPSKEPITESIYPFKLTTSFQSNMTQKEYTDCFNKIINYLEAGDCYQVNLAQRFSANFTGDPWSAYSILRVASPAPFSAFLNFPHCTLLSHSPESFLTVKGDQVETCPIKGTRGRKSQIDEDAEQARLLSESIKDKAENLMIVDLMRNDIGRNCSIGSIKVTKLFALESYSNVHHLVSTVQGKLNKGRNSVELLRDSFPGGSITGAPKRRAMEIIAELEPDPRNAYCGSIGYLGFNGDMNTNIAIRTLQCVNNTVHVWGGGGIVADSECDSEYEESIQKVRNLMSRLKNLQKK